MKKIALAALVAASLGGCGGSGVSVTTEAGSGDATEAGSVIDRIKSLFFKTEVKATIQYPASQLIFEAIWEGEDAGQIARLRPHLAQKLQRPVAADDFYELLPADELLQMLQNPAIRAQVLREGSPPLVAAIESGDETRIRDALKRNGWRLPTAFAVSPCPGWEVDSTMTSGAQDEAEELEAHQTARAYLHLMEASTHFTNAIFTEIASKIAPQVWRDPTTARAAIVTAWHAIPVATFEAIWAEAVTSTGQTPALDFTGKPAGVGWSAGGSRYDCAGSGVVQAKGGATWFGDGKLTGRSYDIGLVSSLGAEMRKGGSQTDGYSAGSRTDSSGRAGVGK